MDLRLLGKFGPNLVVRMLICSGVTLIAATGVSRSANADELMSVPPAPANLMSRPGGSSRPLLTPAAANAGTSGVLVEMGEASLKAGQYEDAIALFEKAAGDADLDRSQRERIIGLTQTTADALFQRGTRFPDNNGLDASIRLFSGLLTIIDKAANPGSLAAAQNSLGKALTAKSARFGDHPMLEKGISTIRNALAWRTYEQSPVDWAQSQLDLAEALIASARISDTNEKFDEAIEICASVIAKKRSELLDAARAKAHAVMANALWQYGQRERDATLILGAKNSAQQALDGTDRAALPFEWATALNYLANANREFSYWTSDPQLLALSVTQYNQSLEVRTRENYPLQWAQTQLDLGNALTRNNDPNLLPGSAELAVQAYQHSLEIRTESNTPLEWGMAQNNLAASLSANLEQKETLTADDYAPVLAAYQNAIKVTTRERSPLDWALMQTNLASELVDKWNAKQRTLPDDFQREMDAAMRSQEFYPLRIHFELHKLASAKILERQQSVADLENAIVAYDNALQVYTKTARPWKWINAIHNKANAYQQIGIKQQNPRPFVEALKIYREEQTILQQQYDPRSWAGLEISAGNALYYIGSFSWNSAKLREAETAYLQAIEAMPRGYEQKRDETVESLAYTMCFIGGLDADKAKIQEGVDRYQSLKQSSYTPKRMSNVNAPQRIEHLNQEIANCYSMIDTLAEAKPEQ